MNVSLSFPLYLPLPLSFSSSSLCPQPSILSLSSLGVAVICILLEHRLVGEGLLREEKDEDREKGGEDERQAFTVHSTPPLPPPASSFYLFFTFMDPLVGEVH